MDHDDHEGGVRNVPSEVWSGPRRAALMSKLIPAANNPLVGQRLLQFSTDARNSTYPAY